MTRHAAVAGVVYRVDGPMELDLATWLADSRIVGLLICAACIAVLRTLE